VKDAVREGPSNSRVSRVEGREYDQVGSSREEDELMRCVTPSKSKAKQVLVTLALMMAGILAALPGAAAAGRPPIFVTNYVSTVFELSPSGPIRPIVGNSRLDFARAITVARNGQLLVHDRSGVVRVNPDNGHVRHVASGLDVYWWRDLEQADTGFIYGTSAGYGGDIPRPAGVVRVNPENGRTKIVAHGRLFYDPQGIALARDGQIYVGDQFRRPSGALPGAILRVNPRNGKVRRVWTSLSIRRMTGVDYADGRLYAAVSGHSPKIVRVNPRTGSHTVIARGPSVGAADLSVASNGDIYLAAGKWVSRIKRGHHRAQVVNEGSPFPWWLYGIVVGH
jgi:sugar lactone lactonase YvrE